MTASRRENGRRAFFPPGASGRASSRVFPRSSSRTGEKAFPGSNLAGSKEISSTIPPRSFFRLPSFPCINGRATDAAGFSGKISRRASSPERLPSPIPGRDFRERASFRNGPSCSAPPPAGKRSFLPVPAGPRLEPAGDVPAEAFFASAPFLPLALKKLPSPLKSPRITMPIISSNPSIS